MTQHKSPPRPTAAEAIGLLRTLSPRATAAFAAGMQAPPPTPSTPRPPAARQRPRLPPATSSSLHAPPPQPGSTRRGA